MLHSNKHTEIPPHFLKSLVCMYPYPSQQTSLAVASNLCIRVWVNLYQNRVKCDYVCGHFNLFSYSVSYSFHNQSVKFNDGFSCQEDHRQKWEV